MTVRWTFGEVRDWSRDPREVWYGSGTFVEVRDGKGDHLGGP